jgi:hypothetical protein
VAIPMRSCGERGPLRFRYTWGNLSNYEMGMRVLLYPIGGNLCQSKTYKLELTFVKTCSDPLASHQIKCDCAWPARQHAGSLIVER